MIVREAYRFRAYPDADMADRLTRGIGCVRLVYNLALSQREMFGRVGRQLDPIAELVALKREFPFLKTDAFSQSLQSAILDLDKAYKAFFEKRSGYPTPRCKYENDSMHFPQPYTKQGPQIILGRDSIKLPKFGWLKIVRHRKMKGRLRNVTVSLDSGHWYVALQTEIEVRDPVIRSELPSTGLDMGVRQPVVTAAGEVIALPQMSRDERQLRANLARALSRKVKKSVGRRQARLALRCFDRWITNRRNDARHKSTTRLVKSHGLIGIEDLKLRNMTRSARGTLDKPGKQVAQKAGLNRRMLDVSPGEFRRQLEYKGRWSGTVVIAVPAAYTSQNCSCCGARNRIKRDQDFSCTACGAELCRDTNAARNVEARALKEYGRRTGGVCPWTSQDTGSVAETPKAAMIAVAMQAGRSLAIHGEE